MMVRVPEYLKQSHDQLQRKFTAINKIEDAIIDQALSTPTSETISHTLNASLQRHNRFKNRYSNVFPYDQNRVKLKNVRDPLTDDYINASYIRLVSKSGRDTFSYISTQGPTSVTELDFWTMISEIEGDQLNIVMLTPYEENGREKCFNYLQRLYPGSTSTSTCFGSTTHSNSFQFKLNDISKSESLQVVNFTLSVLSRDETSIIRTKTITHYHVLDWDDFGKPNEWKTLHTISQAINSKNNKIPTVVHCSAGVGRSGTFIVLDYLFNSPLEDLVDVDRDEDVIYDTVKELRQFRVMMVQSFNQYNFLYSALLQFIENLSKN
ncbi:hypothetical protein WICPIJ_001203 [Wickerhamomyces pijperi]|uniref:Protein-tyrosine-phosphatase n=1 Tax=Wickerhamomyces pijperi TaxID=599730 RepID=A0A9P8TQ52_WICPI|nr:hypothetical protein WICPIJ_001203 [Wickerhamomyces pijperi]